MSNNDEKVEQQAMSSDDDRQLKNAVFAAKQAVEGTGKRPQNYPNQQAPMHDKPEVTREEYARRELGFDIPVDAVPLPSKGLVYPPGHSLHNKASVEFRAMTAKEEDILMSRALIKKGTVVSELIRSCVMDPNLDPKSLISGDQYALMIAIRASGYGPRYEPTYICPNCSSNNELSVDLNELPISNLEIEPAEPYTNLFHFTLPMTKKTVGFRFSTAQEQENMLREMEAKKKRGLLNDALVTTRLLHSIVEIDGNQDRNAIARFVQYMPAGDSLQLRSYIDNNEPGVDMSYDFQCNFCEFGQQMQLPIGANFLWPSAGR